MFKTILLLVTLPFYFSKNILAETSIQTSMIHQQTTHPTITDSCITDNCICSCQNYICNCACSTQYPERTTINTINMGTTVTKVSSNIDTTGNQITSFIPISTLPIVSDKLVNSS